MGWFAAMGRVQDEAPAKTAKAANKGSATLGALGSFFMNLLRADQFKPTQGKIARLWTGIGLALLVGAGIYQFHEYQLKGNYGPVAQFGIPALLALTFGWVVWRTVNFPPFADFLIATESEMNKVSWTSREDLRKATIVVLATVFFLAIYLFGVDYLWSTLLKMIGVLKVNSDAFGSQAG